MEILLVQGHLSHAPPVIIRWDNGGMSKKTTFGLPWVNKPWEKSLEELVEDCEPATFGFDGKDVLDEKIRKAGKLEAHQFSTNFNPYDYGIVNTIAQELLPGIVRAGKQPAVEGWGVVAELYKLNVYSGPSGMFKSHVDTPRGRTQFGSLVVCLPTEFKGNISPLKNTFRDLLLRQDRRSSASCSRRQRASFRLQWQKS